MIYDGGDCEYTSQYAHNVDEETMPLIVRINVKDRHWVGAYGLLVVRMCTFVEADLFRCGNTKEEPDDRGIFAVWHTVRTVVSYRMTVESSL